MRRTLLSVAVALLAAGCVTVRPDSGGRQAALADAHAPAPHAPPASAPRPPRGMAGLVRTGSLSRQWPGHPAPAGLHSSSQERRPVPAVRPAVATPHRPGAPEGRRPSDGRTGRRPAAPAARPVSRSAPGHGASARPAAHGLTVPAHQDPDTFAVCGLVQDMGLDQAVTAVC